MNTDNPDAWYALADAIRDYDDWRQACGRHETAMNEVMKRAREAVERATGMRLGIGSLLAPPFGFLAVPSQPSTLAPGAEKKEAP